MLPCSFFNTVEFYVICAFVAAAVIAAVSTPSRKGAARTFLFAGTLIPDAEDGGAGIRAEVDDFGYLVITRFGFRDLCTDGAYSLAVEIAGFDVIIKERVTPGRHGFPVPAARCVVDCLGRERYHFQYISEHSRASAAFSLNIRPGNKVERKLEA